jgi:hypothetical protein
MDPMSGRITTLLTRCRDLIAASPSWQSWCGSPTAASQQVSIIASEIEDSYPQIIIDLAPGLVRNRTDVDGEPFTTSASLLVYVVTERDATTTVADAVQELWDRCEAILGDLGESFVVQANGAHVTTQAVEDGPRLVRAKDLNRSKDQVDMMWSLAVVNWP